MATEAYVGEEGIDPPVHEGPTRPTIDLVEAGPEPNINLIVGRTDELVQDRDETCCPLYRPIRLAQEFLGSVAQLRPVLGVPSSVTSGMPQRVPPLYLK